MRHLTLLLLLFLAAACAERTPVHDNEQQRGVIWEPSSPAGFGKAHPFNGGWRFYLGDAEGAAEKAYDDHAWQDVRLPHDWSVKQPASPTLASATGWRPGGIGWYRKTFALTPGQKDKKIWIYFGGIYHRSEVFINGHSIGRRPNGYISFLYDATPYLVADGDWNAGLCSPHA